MIAALVAVALAAVPAAFAQSSSLPAPSPASATSGTSPTLPVIAPPPAVTQSADSGLPASATSVPALNPNLTPACAAAFNQTILQIRSSCQIVNSDPSQVIGTTFDASVLDKVCSTTCTSAYAALTSAALPVCGDQLLYTTPTVTPGGVLMPAKNVTVATLIAEYRLSSAFYCLKDGDKYCLPQELAEIAKMSGIPTTAPAPGTSGSTPNPFAALLSPSFLCSTCVRKHIQILQDAKAYYPTYEFDIAPLLQLVLPIVATCKAAGNAALAAVSAPFSAIAAGLLAVAAALL
ncbi:hypothetical protein BC831DRAFT_470139 [Entophlyctis helioformis]|nr:hypothetical protein BC831DRAFT_470139 [Entophlyctis helioformis]